jgi:hypothetical protein
MALTRKELLAGGAAAALGAAGIYELVDRLSGGSPARPAVASAPPEQHLLEGIRVVRSDGIKVIVPPLHHEVVTARLDVDPSDRRDAQADFEKLLAGIEGDLDPSPAGLGVTVGWGLPYFHRFVPEATSRYLPRDKRADKPVLVDAQRFPSDPSTTVLETNDVVIQLRSDVRAHIDAAVEQLQKSSLLTVTSLRRGFVGGGFEGRQSLPKQMAMAANVPGAELIPETSELFLGFTSTQHANMGPGKIANFETLGLVDFRGSDYFRHGTHMHLSHIKEDLETWYINFEYDERVVTAFRPYLHVRENTQTVPQGPKQAQTQADVERDFASSGRIGHSGSIQSTSRLLEDVVGPDGTRYAKGSAIPVRADFNTLDNPFFYSDRKAELQPGPAAGVHFVVFNPSSDDFHRNRLAMDGVLPGKKLPLEAGSRQQGFNSILKTTHRQNYLVPPRVHRSFPLAEL